MRQMVSKLEAESGHVEMSFPYFINKTAPISGVQSLMDYEVTFIDEIDKGVYRQTMKVVVPVTTDLMPTLLMAICRVSGRAWTSSMGNFSH